MLLLFAPQRIENENDFLIFYQLYNVSTTLYYTLNQSERKQFY